MAEIWVKEISLIVNFFIAHLCICGWERDVWVGLCLLVHIDMGEKSLPMFVLLINVSG